MTISSTSRKAGPYVGNDVAAAFPFAFKVFAASDLYVVRTDSLGAESVLTSPSDYTVALNSNQDNNPGGTINLTAPLATSYTLTIASWLEYLQPTDLTNQGGFYPKVITNALDRLTILIQQLAEAVASSGTGVDSGLRAAIAASSGAARMGFIQSGTGATTRTVQSKLREVGVSPYDFGATGNGIADDTANVQKAIDAVFALGGGIVDCSGGKWLIDSAHLIVKKGVTLQGQWNNAGEEATRDYTRFDSCFILNSAYSIKLYEDFSAIKGMVVVRKGITVPTSLAAAATHVAAFAGTAILVGDGTSGKANDTYAGYCFILGFQYAYYNDYNERPRIEYLSGDNTNGIYLNRIYDMNHMVGCHFWPYTTTHQSWTLTGDAGWRRQGTAYYFGLGVDWGQANNCFSYGYDNGFHVNGSDNVVLLNCGNDGWKNNNTYSVGFRVEGTTKNLNMIGCKAAAKNTSVLIDIKGGGTSQCVKITGGNLWACSTGTGSHVYVKNGFAILSGGLSMFDGPVGVKTDSTAKTISVIGCIFQNIGTPYSISNPDNSNIFGNSYDGSVDGTTGAHHAYDSQAGQQLFSFANTSGSTGYLMMRHCAGSLSAPTASPNGAQAFRAYGSVYDGSAYGNLGAIRFTLRSAPSSGNTPGGFIISTTPTASSTPVDRVMVNETGNFYPIVDNAYACGASGVRWSAIWSANGTIQTSDRRTKEDIQPAALGLDFIQALRPVSYKWKVGGVEVMRQRFHDKDGNEIPEGEPLPDDAIPGEFITREKPGNRTHWGLIAQEVKEVCDKAGVDFGGWVLSDATDPNSQQALRYDQFIAPLIKAVQELAWQVNYLSGEINIIKNYKG